MADKIPAYYDRNANAAVAPFILGSIAHSQTTLVLAPRDMAEHGDEMLAQIFTDTPATKSFPFIKMFSFQNKYVVSLSFPSTIAEKDTGRKGLFLTLGLEVDPSFVKNGSFPHVSAYLKLFMALFGSLGVNLYTGDADKIVSRLQTNSNYRPLGETFMDYAAILGNSALYKKPTIRSVFEPALQYLSPTRFIRKKRLPRFLVHLDDTTVKDYIDISLDLVDDYLESLGQIANTTIATDVQGNINSTVFTKLDKSLVQAQGIEIKKLRNTDFFYIR